MAALERAAQQVLNRARLGTPGRGTGQMGFFTDLLIEVGAIMLFAVGFHVYTVAKPRHWLWIAGAAGIVLMMWLRGFERPSTYAVAVGWALVIYYLDTRITEKAADGSEKPARRKRRM
jgi:hypothetical protein